MLRHVDEMTGQEFEFFVGGVLRQLRAAVVGLLDEAA